MPCKRVFLSTGAPLENMEGIRRREFFREKFSVCVLSWTQRALRFWVWGPSGKGTGLSWVDIRLWGTKGPSMSPGCIGTVRARTQCKSIDLSWQKLLWNASYAFNQVFQLIQLFCLFANCTDLTMLRVCRLYSLKLV
jgi:hypothetical protein